MFCLGLWVYSFLNSRRYFCRVELNLVVSDIRKIVGTEDRCFDGRQITSVLQSAETFSVPYTS